MYRQGWGETPWTGVEDRAIRDLYLRDWRRILLYSIDDTHPTWLGQTYIYASKRFGLSALAVLLERKVQEDGGNVGPEDVVAMAQRIAR